MAGMVADLDARTAHLGQTPRTFGIHYHNRKRVNPQVEEELEATYWDSLDQMLARMDIISVNCPSTPATFHLLSARRIALMQPTAYMVNTARGQIIDENALIELIEQGKLAGAGLDVFENEPAVNPRLLALAEKARLSCCRIWVRPPWKAASIWATRSSSISRLLSTDIARPTAYCRTGFNFSGSQFSFPASFPSMKRRTVCA